MRTRARQTASALAVLTLLTACGDHELLDPTEEPLVSEREDLVAELTGGLDAVADELGAGDPLATRVDTRCSAGTDNWKIQDQYRSTCEVAVTMAFPVDVDPFAGLGGLPGIERFEASLRDAGWGAAHWSQEDGDGYGVDSDWLRQSGRPVVGLSGVRLWNGDAHRSIVRLGVLTATDPVEPPREPLDSVEHSPVGIYHGDTEGSDWQDVWATERGTHGFVLVGHGEAVLAEQPG